VDRKIFDLSVTNDNQKKITQNQNPT